MANNFSTNLRGSHWSYLILNKCHGKFYHFDSIIIGLKLKYAKQLANNIGLNNCEIYENLRFNRKTILNAGFIYSTSNSKCPTYT